MRDIAATPADTPLHRHSVEFDAAKAETVKLPRGLSDDFAWYIPGVAQAVMAMQEPLLGLFRFAYDLPLRTPQYQAGEPLFRVKDGDVSRNPVAYEIFGIPLELAAKFNGFIESYAFERKSVTEKPESWSVSVVPYRIADPLWKGGIRGITVNYLLPTDNLLKRSIRLPEQNLLLNIPTLQVVKL